jgi:diguanylate cyclase (GGDEF)-like protein/PAS domain S-box-containing protein
MTNFTQLNIQNFIDILNYPVIIINKESFPIYKNKKFKSFEKKEDFLIKQEILGSLKYDEYVIESDMKSIHFKLSKSPIQIEHDECIIVSFFDISVIKKLVKDLSAKQNLFNQLTEQLPESIILFDERIIYINKTFEKLIGYTEKEILDKTFIDLLDLSDQEIFFTVLEKLSSSRKTQIETSLKIQKKNLDIIWIRINIKRIKQNEKFIFLAVISDISKDVKEINTLSQLAYYDKLTGIYNRRKLDELLLMEHKLTKRYGRPLSALFFDIDHFKNVNDTYGHDAGDMVLSNLATLISQEIRETDIFARWGGEEFIILLPETKNEEAIILAEEIMMSLSMYTFEQVGKITISIGISSIQGKERLPTFTKRLDDALYKAKKEGRNRFILL